MKRLELLLEQKCSDRLEGFLVFYSCNIAPPGPPKEIPMSSISVYADSLNKQFGVPSPNVKPQAPSSLPTAETFNPQDVTGFLSELYKPSVSEEEIIYANSLNKQFNAPSTTVKPTTFQTSSHLSPQNFHIEPILEAIKHPACPSLSNTLTVPSSPTKVGIYNPPELKFIEPALKFDTIKITPGLRPEKKFYDDFKMKHSVRISGFKDESPVYDFFKGNELPRIYDQVAKGLKLSKYAVKTITFTNPLKNEDDFSPSFTSGTREIRLPAIKPKTIPFDFISQKDYNKMVNNAFLPHELGHAKIDDIYDKHFPKVGIHKDELKGFNEHLADAFAFDSVRNTPQIYNTKTERIKFEDKWVTPSPNSYLSQTEKDYCEAMVFGEHPSLIPGKQATINMLGEQVLKGKYDTALKNVLDAKYGDDTHKETVYNNINKLSNFYQDQAVKLVNLSKKNSIFSDFRAKKILSTVEKENLRFVEGL